MVPYCGKHGTEQFMQGKPIWFGFQLWCITFTDGYLLHAEPHCGCDTILDETSFGLGDVTIGVITKYMLSEGGTVMFENLFTSLLFVDELS